MKFFIMKLMMVSSTMLPMLSNPMSMGILLLFQTMLMTLLMNKMLMSSWFSMITFLMMIGGLLIIFTYMSSIASNEKFKFNINLMPMMLIMMLITDEMMLVNQIKENQMINSSMMFEHMSMIKLYTNKSMFLSMLMMIYLLLTMIVVSKIVKHSYGPLRKKTYE
nr:NADH dehydrogenase subunit 6 [Mileewa rufivena]